VGSAAAVVGWRLRRLRAMGLAEVAARIARTVRHRTDDLAWRYAPPLWRRSWSAPPVAASRAAPAPLGFLTAARAAAVLRGAPDQAAATVALAGEVVEGRVRYFGYPTASVGVPADFSRDPHAGTAWPPRHGKLLDYRHFGSDPKWIWELNRCQEAPLLISAWLLSGDDRYATHAVGHLLAWIEQNPPGRGIAWSNGYEAGVRAMSLAVAYDALRGSGLLGAPEANRLLAGLWQHARWIRRDPSSHSSANNHRIGELTGLVAIALLAPELDRAAALQRRALAELAREAERQILPDGVSAEAAFGYGTYVVDMLLVVVALLDARGVPTPPAILSALESAARGLAAQLGPGEPAPAYGDADDARALRLDGDEVRNPRAVAAALAARLGHRGARASASAPDPSLLWMFGAEGVARFETTTPERPPGSVHLAAGGLTVLRAARTRAIFDSGPLGYLSIAAHGHADALQVVVSEGGEDLVVDPGTGPYWTDPGARDAFRGTRMHATVSVDGGDQSQPGGPFLWTRHAEARTDHVDLERAAVIGSHDGYLGLDDPVRHRRAVVLLPSGWVLVYDRLEAAGTHRYAGSWPLHPSLEAELVGPATLRAWRDGRPRLLIEVAATAPGSARLLRGSTDPYLGWWSDRLESMQPAPDLAWEAEAGGGLEIATVICPLAADGWPQPELTIDGDRSSTRVGLRDFGADSANPVQTRVTISLDAPEPIVIDRSHA
jgi:hypothetical protein